mmetsp:Transcript_104978/g.208704  ORF Transcript_104978/g.208704 Transcript_104978/m.208704 type:complete len:204 (-) Transcript_104978:40-651(-)
MKSSATSSGWETAATWGLIRTPECSQSGDVLGNGSVAYTSSTAARNQPLSKASRSAASETTSPRPTLISSLPAPQDRSTPPSSRPRVCGVEGRTLTTTSALPNTCRRSVVTESKPGSLRSRLANPSVRMPKACACPAMTAAMSPTPRMPIVRSLRRGLFKNGPGAHSFRSWTSRNLRQSSLKIAPKTNSDICCPKHPANRVQM